MTPELQAEIAKTLAFDHGGPYGVTDQMKWDAILGYVNEYKCDTLIETGTNVGDTMEEMRHYLKDVYSIEIGPQLYENAKKRFANCANVHLIWGDAGEILGPLLSFLDPARKVIFYLDAHSRYDETSPAGRGIGTSVPKEVAAIARYRPKSVVLIDDARLFTHKFNKDWPELTATIEGIEALNLWNVELKNDMIRLTPKA